VPSNALIRIDPGDASWESVGTATFLDGLAYSTSDGFLYGTSDGGNALVRINPLDASWETVGTATFVDGFAYIPIPEVSSGVFMALAGGMLLLRRRGIDR
jgi:hypothetical protein